LLAATNFCFLVAARVVRFLYDKDFTEGKQLITF